MSLVRFIAALALATIGIQPMAAPVQVTPAFGYRIGDSVVATGRVSIDDAARLDPQSLPRTGRVNGWLALHEVRVIAEPGGRRIVRTFQVTASAAQPRLLFLPRVALKFTLGGREVTEQLESVPISVSPLATAEPVLRTGFGALRPDRDVPDPDAAQSLNRMQWLAAILAALIVLWLAVRSYAIRRRGFAPFGSAARKLRRLARRSRAGADVKGAAFRVMHDAFNETAGRAVFASHRETFLAAHSYFELEAAAVRSFFDRSNQVFFSSDKPDGLIDLNDLGDLGDLGDLASRLARLERPRR